MDQYKLINNNIHFDHDFYGKLEDKYTQELADPLSYKVDSIFYYLVNTLVNHYSPNISSDKINGFSHFLWTMGNLPPYWNKSNNNYKHELNSLLDFFEEHNNNRRYTFFYDEHGVKRWKLLPKQLQIEKIVFYSKQGAFVGNEKDIVIRNPNLISKISKNISALGNFNRNKDNQEIEQPSNQKKSKPTIYNEFFKPKLEDIYYLVNLNLPITGKIKKQSLSVKMLMINYHEYLMGNCNYQFTDSDKRLSGYFYDVVTRVKK